MTFFAAPTASRGVRWCDANGLSFCQRLVFFEGGFQNGLKADTCQACFFRPRFHAAAARHCCQAACCCPMMFAARSRCLEAKVPRDVAAPLSHLPPAAALLPRRRLLPGSRTRR